MSVTVHREYQALYSLEKNDIIVICFSCKYGFKGCYEPMCGLKFLCGIIVLISRICLRGAAR